MIPHSYHITRVQVDVLVREFSTTIYGTSPIPYKIMSDKYRNLSEIFQQTIRLYGTSHIPYKTMRLIPVLNIVHTEREDWQLR